MDDEADICRVCHSESTPEQPLFHPCKCSGSIRYIHQFCLIQWLNHSQMTIKLVYRSDMPEVIPPALMFQQFNKKLRSGLLFALRATFVGLIWLIILPYITVWIWRLYFFLGDNVSSSLFKLKEAKHQLGSNTSALNLTSIFFTALSDNDTVTANWMQEYKSRFSMHAFFSDCFEGQIITSIVVVFFISVFLLKEWIIQNIPMEVLPLDDEQPVFEPAFQEELIQPDSPNPRFDDLFDGDWGEEYNEPTHIYADLNGGPFNQATNLNPFNLPVRNERARAASMPPDFGSHRTSSAYEEREDEFDRDERHFRRAVSMEPAIDTTLLDPRTHFSPQTPEYHGPPPFAPRMRHAEANMPIRPIIEEIELPEPIEPLVEEPIVEEVLVQEFEGILEAIGMDGSLVSLLQNSTLMGLLIALILGVTVCVPYLIGVFFIMLNALDLIRIPLELVRMITDPFIDFLFLLWPDYIWPFICNLYHSCIQPLLECTVLFDKATAAFSQMFTYPSLSGIIATNTNVTESVLDQSIQYATKFINGTEPLMELALNRYQQFATGHTVIDRLVCIAIGYAIIVSFSSWYLSGNTRDSLAIALFGLTAREAFLHQCIVLKVGFFIFLELGLFPVVCGSVINVSTLPLFKEATLLSRGKYLIAHPIIFIFLHWMIGTSFMFLFTLLVTVCRDILRSGVMWFIRDPGDPQFHPVREIAERPALAQLKKISASACIYTLIILVGIAGVVQCIKSIGAGILPLRWNLSHLLVTRGPISVVPIDIIMLQVAVPAFIKNFKPTELLLSVSVKWLRFVCRKLRLTSFMFGKRKSREEGTLVYHTWWAWIRCIEPVRVPRAGTQESLIGDEVSYIWTGQLLRVPSHDSVPIVGNRRMLVPVHPDTLEPIDETERILGHPAATLPGGNDTNTAIVYSPPHLIRRLVFFALIMWLSCTAAFCYITLFPVVLGRHLFKEVMKIETEVHDLYSFILGISVLFYIGYSIVQVYNTLCDIWARPTWILRMRRSRRLLRRLTRRVLHWGWFITWFAIVLPLVFGILFKLYVSFPLTSVGKEAITIKLLPVWSQGLSCMLVFYRVIQYAPPGPAKDMIDNIFRLGIGRMDIKASFTKLIAPLLIASVCSGCLPFATAYVNIFVTG
ncbi:hypothetical protein MFLAVUS_002974 [Mucor flavus]|uniref:RING-type E3 ubiquitin transferase n=1 Tax=Mucor flavus TaxID=439312 RepID=A0ABP9YRS4_9FUNG